MDKKNEIESRISLILPKKIQAIIKQTAKREHRNMSEYIRNLIYSDICAKNNITLFELEKLDGSKN